MNKLKKKLNSLSEIDFKKIKIPSCLCGHRDYQIESHFKNFNPKLEYPHLVILSCKKCKLKRSFPPPNYFSTFNLYDEVADTKQIKRDVLYNSFAKELLRTIKKFKKKGHLLDIGCGRGNLVKIASSEGFDAEGIDIDKKRIKYGKEILKADIKYGNIMKTRISKKFDVIVLSSVIEHFEKPDQLLKKIRKNLKQKGIIFIDIPRYDTPIRKILKRRWYAYALGEHFWYFNKKHLISLVKNSGYDPVDIIIQCNFYNPEKIIKFWPINSIKFSSLILKLENRILGEYLQIGDKLLLIAKQNE